MKIKTIMNVVLAVGLLAGCETEKGEGHEKQEQLMSQARISKQEATRIAMERVPNGTIKEAELEQEHGKLQWSFDMATPGTRDTTEVNVDALTGSIISVDKESPESEKKESDDEKGRK